MTTPFLTAAQVAAMDETIEAAYWEMTSRRDGIGRWKGAPQSERDAFKQTVRSLLLGRNDQCVIAAYHHGLSCRAYVQWWGPNQSGYVNDLTMAGIYEPGEAARLDIGQDNAIPVPLAFLRDARLRQMLDVGDHANAAFRSHKYLRLALRQWRELHKETA